MQWQQRNSSRCAVALVAAGLSLGVGWVAAGNNPGGAGDSGADSTQPANTPATDPPAVPLAAADLPKEEKPADRLDKLQKQSKALEDLILGLEKRIEREAPDTGDVIDLAALQAELLSLDKQILSAEQVVRTRRDALDATIKNKAAVVQGPLDKNLVARVIEDHPMVVDAKQQVRKVEELIATLQKTYAKDHPIIKATEKELEAANTGVKTKRESLRKGTEELLRERAEREAERQVEYAKSDLQHITERVTELQAERKKLVERIALQKQRDSKRQQLQEELRVLRQLQLELFRQKTVLELGIEVIPVPPPNAPNPQVEAQLKELRREVEVLRAEIEKLKKK